MDPTPRQSSYLPMDCPVCGRRRLLASIDLSGDHAFIAAIDCEKCGHHWPEDDDE